MIDRIAWSNIALLLVGLLLRLSRGSGGGGLDFTANVSPFAIVIDGGSTGSRLHVLEFVVDNNGHVECVRRGSARANGPLSAFGRQKPDDNTPINATVVAAHLLPAFQEAAALVPRQYHASTPVQYAATAGMRLLPKEEQDAVYDALHIGLRAESSFVFPIHRDNIFTLAGELEGYYGAVAANYFQGTIDANLVVTQHGRQHGPIGALDMGGSSTQIVFLPNEDDDVQTVVPHRLNGDDFFATSYLSYGADQFRERLWSTWITDYEAKQAMSWNQTENVCPMPPTTTTTTAMARLDNPCSFAGYEQEFAGYTMVGTGDTSTCIREVQRLIPHPTEHMMEKLGTHVGGVEHPAVRGKFFAMSLFFFTLDCLRHLSATNAVVYQALNTAWPNPSIRELHDALDVLCSRSWPDDLALIQDDAHAFSRAEVLPHRCFESVYMVTLLKDGFGFEDESRDITFTFLIDDSEVEWSLGMALSNRAEARAMANNMAEAADGNNDDTKAGTTKQQERRNHTFDGVALWDLLARQLYSAVVSETINIV